MVRGMAEPQLIKTESRWLALSPPDARFHVGVVGADEDEARRRLAQELAAWDRLAALPDEQSDAEATRA